LLAEKRERRTECYNKGAPEASWQKGTKTKLTCVGSKNKAFIGPRYGRGGSTMEV